jgi:hypothetical protein
MLSLEQEQKQDSSKVIEQKPSSNPKLTTKEELIANVKEWIKLDTELTKLKRDVKDKTKRMKMLTNTLVDVMKNNSINCFDINGGALVYKQKKTKKSISGKFLLAQLETYYTNQPELAKEVVKAVLDNREQVVKEEIKRKINK